MIPHRKVYIQIKMTFGFGSKKLLFFCSLLLSFYWTFTPLHTQDGPNHKKVALILSRLSQSPAEHQVYQYNLHPLQTNELFPMLYLTLSHWMTPDQYEKVFFILCLLFLLGSYWYFLKEWSPQSLDAWIFILPLSFYSLFMMGMYNYMISVPLTFVGLIYLKRGLYKPKPAIDILLFTLISWLSFLAHPFPFFIWGICLLLLSFDKKHSSISRKIFLAIPILFFYFVGFFIPLIQTSQQEHGVSYKFSSIPELLGGFIASNIALYSIPEIFLNLLFVGVMIYLAVKSWRETKWNDKKFWLAILLLYCIFPKEGSQGSYLNTRFLIFLWCFIPLGLSGNSLKKIVYIPLCLWVILCFLNYSEIKRINLVFEEAKQLMTKLPDQTSLYPLNFNAKSSTLNFFPFMHLWAAYPDSKIIFSPYLFAHSQLMPLYRTIPSSPTYFPATRDDFPQEIAKEEICKNKQNPLETLNCYEILQRAYEDVFQKAHFYEYWFVYDPPSEFLKQMENKPDIQKLQQINNISLWKNTSVKEFIPSLPHVN